MRPVIITKRSDFLHTQQNGIVCKKPFILLTASHNQQNIPRFGFTISKKIGSAVIRNKIKRRLKSIVKTILTHPNNQKLSNASFDFVFIATPKTAQCDFLHLQNQVKEAIDLVISQ
ncbi:MAG: ribonuclease P protein component [Alphaproteobacteria bacterium]